MMSQSDFNFLIGTLIVMGTLFGGAAVGIAWAVFG